MDVFKAHTDDCQPNFQARLDLRAAIDNGLENRQ